MLLASRPSHRGWGARIRPHRFCARREPEESPVDLQRWDRAKELVGNTFELTALIQKRCRELVKGKQRKLVDLESRNPIQIALEEVLQNKIHLAPPPPAQVMQEMAAPQITPEATTTTAPVGAPEEIQVKID
jgi:DNA-directed RNA polymerase subunit K/omega